MFFQIRLKPCSIYSSKNVYTIRLQHDQKRHLLLKLVIEVEKKGSWIVIKFELINIPGYYIIYNHL